MKIIYSVDRADWLGEPSDEFDADPKSLFYGILIHIPSNEIDERTIRSHFFDTLEEAETYANAYMSDNDHNSEWLAYLEIKKHVIETVKKLK